MGNSCLVKIHPAKQEDNYFLEARLISPLENSSGEDLVDPTTIHVHNFKFPVLDYNAVAGDWHLAKQ